MNINQLVKKISGKLKEKNLSLVTIESCTGGGIAYCFTQSAESSCVLERGYIVYSSAAKAQILDLSANFLQMHAFVSKEMATQMAEKALKKSKSHISVAVTGVEGGEKKGCIWVSCASFNGGTVTKQFQISSHTRKSFCELSILECLKHLNEYLDGLV